MPPVGAISGNRESDREILVFQSYSKNFEINTVC